MNYTHTGLAIVDMQRYWLPRIGSPSYLNQRKLLIDKISALATRILEGGGSVLNITYGPVSLVSGLKWLDDDSRVLKFSKGGDGILAQNTSQKRLGNQPDLTPVIDIISGKKVVNIVGVCSTACVLEVYKDMRFLVNTKVFDLSQKPKIRVLGNYSLNTTADSIFSRIKTDHDLGQYYASHGVPRPNWKII